jgi:hypothetical protein
MKNITLIKSMISVYLNTVDHNELVDRIATVIQTHPEETRENVLAILTGTAELTVRPANQVEIKCTNDKYSNLSFKEEPKVNFLQGTVECYINYTKTESRWYKSEEDATAERNSCSYKRDDYVIERVRTYDDFSRDTFDLAEWNTGVIMWKR